MTYIIIDDKNNMVKEWQKIFNQLVEKEKGHRTVHVIC
jgi:hypothetical protein